MPVAKSNPRRTLLVSLVALVFSFGLLAVVLVLDGARTEGDGEALDVLEVDTLRARQDDEGVPTCLDDPATGNRPICVFHTGAVDDEGWVAYDAQVDGCALVLPDLGASTELEDRCTGDAYPFDGDGLPQYDVEVVGGNLVIDLGGDGAG